MSATRDKRTPREDASLRSRCRDVWTAFLTEMPVLIITFLVCALIVTVAAKYPDFLMAAAPRQPAPPVP